MSAVLSPTTAPASNQINGIVVSITADAVLVDIGYKTEGTLPLSVFGEKPPAIGDKLLVTSKGRNEEGYYDLSLQRVAQPKDISSLEAAFAAAQPSPAQLLPASKAVSRWTSAFALFMPAPVAALAMPLTSRNSSAPRSSAASSS